MNVRIQMFAVARQLSGRGIVELTLTEGATVADLRRALSIAVPELAGLLPHLMFAINADYAADSTIVPSAAEIACIPPVSGG